MTIAAANLLTPNGGRLPLVIFAGEQQSVYEARLTEWLAVGAQAATDGGATDAALIDAASEAWAYYSAYDEKVQQMSAAPSSTTFGDNEGAQSFSADQRAAFQSRADFWLAEYESRLEASAPAVAAASGAWAIVRSLRSASA